MEVGKSVEITGGRFPVQMCTCMHDNYGGIHSC